MDPVTAVHSTKRRSRGRVHRGVLLAAAIILVAALALRVAEVQRTSYSPTGDARSYIALGSQVAQSGDYSSYLRGAGGTFGPTAYFPPAYPYLLGALDLIDGHSSSFTAGDAGAVQVDRLAGAVIGTAVVALIGLIALELFGPGAALAALVMAAVYPVLIELSGVLVAENLMVAGELAAVWAALRAWRAEDPLAWIVASGLCAALAALAHDNAIVVLLPLAFAVRGVGPVFGRRAVRAPSVLILAALIALAPWLIRDAVVLHRFVPIADEAGITLAGTYNPTSVRATNPPDKWIYFADIPADRTIAHQAPRMTEIQLDNKLTGQALTYIAHHPLSPAQVGWHNAKRLLELDGSHAWEASAASIGLSRGTAEVGVYSFWALGLLALGGLLIGVARRTPPWLWCVPLVLGLSVVFLNAETPRFREGLDPFLILLAAAALTGASRHVRARYLNWRYANRA